MVRPTEREVEILRRIKRGALLVTFVGGRASFTYDDGVTIRVEQGRAFDQRDFRKFRQRGWIVPDPLSRGLFDDAPSQRYTARSVGG